MVTVPQRLLELPDVSVLHRCADLTVLRKRLAHSLYQRPSYVSQHALSLVTRGEQVVYDECGGRIRIAAGRAGLIQRGLYSITDVFAGGADRFEATVVFFSEALLREAVGTRALGAEPLGVVAADGVAAGSPTAPLHVLTDLPASAPARLQPRPSMPSLRGAAVALLTQLAAASAAQAAALASLAHPPRRPLRDFMRVHADKPLTLLDYAYLTGRSERSFRRDFKARFGESPKRWLVARRLERARELLREPTTSVAEVALAVGYTNVSHFIRRYRERFGATPGAERLRTAAPGR